MFFSRSNPLWVVPGPILLFLVFLGLMEPSPLTFNEWVGWFVVWILGGWMVYETCDGLRAKRLWMRVVISLVGLTILVVVTLIWIAGNSPTNFNQLLGYSYAYAHGLVLTKILYRPPRVWAKLFGRLSPYWPPFRIVRKP